VIIVKKLPYRFLPTAALILLLTSPLATAQAQNVLDVHFWVIGGGGGISTSGNLNMTGTIGQHAVAKSTAGGLEVNGGFWHWATPSASPVPEDLPGAPVASRLMDPYPNPFNPATRIGFELAVSGPVRIRVFDARGLMVRNLIHETYPAGRHEILWDGKNTEGGNAPSGVYFVKFEVAGATGTRKMTLLK
jgi:hypothetical protein